MSNLIDQKLHKQLTEDVERILPTLLGRRFSIVANYYDHGVRVGFDVDAKARRSVITSAGVESPVENVVRRLY